MFCLKAKRPEYRDRQQVDLNASGEITVKFVPVQADGVLSSGDK
jgi:hypothetical protein